MENVLSLQPNESIVMQGWLVQRDVLGGAQNEIRTKHSTGYSINRRRYCVLVRGKEGTGPLPSLNSEDAFIAYFSKKPEIRRKDGNNSPLNRSVAKGLAFASSNALSKLPSMPTRLVSSEALNARITKSKFFQSSAGNLIGKLGSVRKKTGQIKLKANDMVFLEPGNVLRIKAGSRYVYLEASKKDLDAMDSSVVIGQWLQAIRQTLKIVSTEVRRKEFQMRGHQNFVSPSAGRTLNLKDKDAQIQIPTSFKKVLKASILRKEFSDYLLLAQGSENLHFYDAATDFKSLVSQLYSKPNPPPNSDFRIKKLAKEIYETYIMDESPSCVNISGPQRRKIIEKFEALEEAEKRKLAGDQDDEIDRQGRQIFDVNLFSDAQTEVFLLMEANFFHGFYEELSRRTGCFASLLYRFELVGYEMVMRTHFSGVKTELERLLRRFEATLKEIDAEVQGTESMLSVSNTVFVPQFTSSCTALRSLYDLNLAKLSLLTTKKARVKDQVGVLRNLNGELLRKLNLTFQEDEMKIKKFKGIEQDKSLIKNFRKELSQVHSDYKSHLITEEDVKERLKEYNVTVLNLESMHSKTENEFQSICSKLGKEKEKLKIGLTASLEKLEAFELYRLGAQKDIIKAILQAETDYVEKLKNSNSEFFEHANRVNPFADMESFSLHVLSHTTRLGDREEELLATD